MDKHDEVSIAHMTMIQGVVTRLETNSFTLKAIAMTLAVAVLAFTGSVKNPNWVYPLSGCLPVIVFWIMDAKYSCGLMQAKKKNMERMAGGCTG